ncbi:hypothetical protein C0995_003558, partial [Termitomyces sp. Mi166
VSASSIQHRQTDPQTCTETSVSTFNLLARYKNDPDKTVPVKVINVNTVPKVGYSILSACPDCATTWQYNVLQNNGILPKSEANPYLNTVSYTLIVGESPTFISTQFTPPPLSAYCFTGNFVNVSGPRILAAYNDAKTWSLCPNVTASGRLDVVWSAIANHPHYSLDNCVGVYLEQV